MTKRTLCALPTVPPTALRPACGAPISDACTAWPPDSRQAPYGSTPTVTPTCVCRGADPGSRVSAENTANPPSRISPSLSPSGWRSNSDLLAKADSIRISSLSSVWADNEPMKFCVYGAGAIGGYLAVELALSGQEVCVVARGAHLEAIRENGLKLVIQGREKVARVAAAEDPRAFGVQDVVVCTLKAHQAYACAPTFAPLLGPATAVLTAMNGIPWWYFYGSGGRFEGHHLRSVDPGGRQWEHVRPQRAIGCVVEPACEVVAPGVVVHHEFNRFTIGEPDGSRSSRVLRLAGA